MGKIFKMLIGGIVGIILVFMVLRIISNTRQAANEPNTSQSTMNDVNVQLASQAGSTQTANAIFEDIDGKTKITVTSPQNTTESQPVSIRAGKCDNLGAISYKLNDMVDGKSETTIAPALHFLHGLGDLALTVHKSNQETGITTSCVDLKPQFDIQMQ